MFLNNMPDWPTTTKIKNGTMPPPTGDESGPGSSMADVRTNPGNDNGEMIYVFA